MAGRASHPHAVGGFRQVRDADDGAGSVSMNMLPIRVLLLDPQRAVGAALADALRTEADLSVVGLVGDEDGAAAVLSTSDVDILLVRVQRQNDVAMIQRLRARHDHLRIVALATVDDPRLALAAVRAGVCSWVPKRLRVGHLVWVLRGVVSGESWFPPALLCQVFDELARPEPPRDAARVAGLSDREREVLRCMVAGLDRQAIAERLVVSRHTVRSHIQNLITKLEVHSRLEAVAIGVRAGLASPDSPLDRSAPLPRV